MLIITKHIITYFFIFNPLLNNMVNVKNKENTAIGHCELTNEATGCNNPN